MKTNRAEQERRYAEFLAGRRGCTVDEALALARQPRPQPYAPPAKPIVERWDNVVSFISGRRISHN